MPQDAFTLKYLCKELNARLSGGKINKIVQPDNDRVIFTVFNGKGTEKLLISANPSLPRIGITNADFQGPLTAPNFCMLLRKHLLSATIKEISLVGFDRIVKIVLSPTSEFFDAKDKVLYAELMGRYSNVILTEDGKVLGGNRGVNNFDNGIRPIIVGLKYTFPPTNQKREPWDSSLIEYFNNFSGDLAEYTANGVQGLALSTAKEIANGYLSKVKEYNGKEYLEYLNYFIENAPVNPCVIYENGEVKDACLYAYSCIKGEKKEYESISVAEDVFFTERENLRRYKDRKDKLNGSINAAIKKSKKRLTAILSREKDAGNAEENKLKGELIIANVYKIPAGAESVVLDNYYDGSQMEVLLDKRLTPSKNAEAYYKKYNKSKRALVMLAEQRENAEKELEYLNSIADGLSFADTIEDLKKIREELENAGILKANKVVDKRRIEKTDFCREYLIEGFIVRAGRNNMENDKLTFSAKSDDLWLHAKDYHSTHVIINANKNEIPEKVILIASEICAYYSKGRESGKVEVVNTKRKYVKKPNGANLGFCTYTDFKSIIVKPNAHTEYLNSK